MIRAINIVHVDGPSSEARRIGPRQAYDLWRDITFALWRGRWRAITGEVMAFLRDAPASYALDVFVDGGPMERITAGTLLSAFRGHDATIGPDHRLCRWAR